MFSTPASLIPQALAQDDPEGDSPAVESPAPDSTDHLYALPQENTVDAIQKFVEKLKSTHSPDRTPDGLRAHFGKIEQAADALLARDVEEAGAIEVIRLKVSALGVLEQLNDTSANRRKQEFVEKLKQDERPGVAVHGRLLDIEGRTSRLQPGDAVVAQQLIDQVVTLLQDKPMTDAHVSLAYTVARAVEANTDAKSATSAYRVFAKYLKASGDANYGDLAARFEGMARRLNIIGNSVEISGTTLDGEAFNITQWQGKVVLVDFWATWCPSCLQEMPNLKALYDKHHADGFEIVGVNLDDNVGRAGALIRTQQLPWPQLVSEKGQDNEIAQYYGAYTLPVTFLVGRDGKVTAVNVFGRGLEEAVSDLMNTDAEN